MASNDSWLTIGQVLTRVRAAGYPESESTLRRMADDGELGEVYRSRGGRRHVRAEAVDKRFPPRSK